MLRSLVSLVTMAAVLWHTLLGCCAHHLHAEQDASAAMATASVPATKPGGAKRRCCHSHRRHSCQPSRQDSRTETAKPETPSEEPSTPCDEADCAFDVSKSVKRTSVDQDGVALVISVPQNPVTVGALRERSEDPAARWPARLRLHLAVCVLRN